MNLYRVFQESAERHRDNPAVVGPGRDDCLSYVELEQAITVACQQMESAGVRSGHTVGLHCDNGANYIALTYAVWRSGGCVVPIPVELSPDEREQVLGRIRLDFLVTSKSPRLFDHVLQSRNEVKLSPDTTLHPLRPSREHPAGFQEINAAFIRFTSGTTGDSKGVVLSHESIFERIQAANEVLSVGAEDCVVWPLSMAYHFTVSIVNFLNSGATIVLPENHFAGGLIDALSGYSATMIYASPAHYMLLCDYDEHVCLPDLRLAISTTGKLNSGVSQRFGQRYGLPLTQALGIIEIGLPCINIAHAAEREGSVGQALPAYELRLDDAGWEANRQEILFRGPGFLDAYYDPWQTREEITADGWFRTGDVGCLDDEGCLFLYGRSNDVINVLGMKFFPQEVEDVLLCDQDVSAACVMAYPHPRLGEVPRAYVVARNGCDAKAVEIRLQRACNQRLSLHKVPERFEFVHELPQTASGKLLHRAQPST